MKKDFFISIFGQLKDMGLITEEEYLKLNEMLMKG